MKRLVVHWSDGDQSMFPAKEALDARLKSDGSQNYYVQLAPDDPRHRQYLAKLSRLFADLQQCAIPEDAAFARLPDGYALFDHVKNRQPGVLKDRHDLYVFGHPSGRSFRSPAEFTPHVHWLANDRTHDRTNCRCDCCGVRKMGFALSRTEISHQILTPAQVVREARKALAAAERQEDRKIGAAWYRQGEVVQYISPSPNSEPTFEPALVISRPELHDNEASVSSQEQAKREQEKYTLYLFRRNDLVRNAEENQILPWLARTDITREGEVRKIVESYSVFDRAGQTDEGVLYNGLFLGAEKIWKGEAVRLIPAEYETELSPRREASVPNEHDSETAADGVKNLKNEVLVVEKIVKGHNGETTVLGTLYDKGDCPFQRRTVPARVNVEHNWKLAPESGNEVLGSDYEVSVVVRGIAGRWYSSRAVYDWTRFDYATVTREVSCRSAVVGSMLGGLKIPFH